MVCSGNCKFYYYCIYFTLNYVTNRDRLWRGDLIAWLYNRYDCLLFTRNSRSIFVAWQHTTILCVLSEVSFWGNSLCLTRSCDLVWVTGKACCLLPALGSTWRILLPTQIRTYSNPQNSRQTGGQCDRRWVRVSELKYKRNTSSYQWKRNSNE